MSLKDHPHVAFKIRLLWGTTEFTTCIDSLLLNSSGEIKQGFDPVTWKDIESIGRIHNDIFQLKSDN